MLDRKAIRAALEAELEALKSRAERIDDHVHQRDRDVPKDSEDLAQFRENDDVIDGLEQITRQEIARIEGALVRMDAGTWGTCGKCKDEIEEARLAALPTAVTCTTCAGV